MKIGDHIEIEGVEYIVCWYKITKDQVAASVEIYAKDPLLAQLHADKAKKQTELLNKSTELLNEK